MENKYHRYLKLPFEAKKPEYCNSVPKVIAEEYQGCFDKNIEEFHRKLGLKIKRYNLLYTKPNSGLIIHSDTSYISNFIKINITWGPENSYTYWWKSNKAYSKSDPASGFKLLQANQEDSVPVWRAKINRPSIVNSGQLHSTYNPTNQGRWTVSYVPVYKDTDELVDWYDALKIYEKYIERF